MSSSLFEALPKHTSTAIFLLLVVALLVAISPRLSKKHDPREPPVIPQSIPYVGHLLGLLRHGEKYMQDLR